MKAPESLSHEEAIELLPWLVNGSLEPSRQELLRNHARFCVVCRRELESLDVLQDFIDGEARSERIPPPDMRNINARIDRLVEKQGWKQNLLRWTGLLTANPWKLAFAIQSVIVIGLALVLLVPSTSEPEFTTLTQPQELTGLHQVRAVFSPETTLAEVTALLDQLELTVASGPTPRGVYTLAFTEGLDSARRKQLLIRLQEQPNVQFAQSVTSFRAADP